MLSCAGAVAAAFAAAIVAPQALANSTAPADSRLAPAPPALEEPFQDLTPDQAIAAIHGTQKVGLVAFHTAWDGESRRMWEHTWADPKVRAWLAEKTVAVVVDGDKEKELALQWKVTTYPVVVLLRPDGRVIDRFKGYHGPETFLIQAEAAITGKLTGKISVLEGERALDPLAHLERAGALYVNTRIDECLDEYLWCLDHADGSDEAFLDRNLDFVLKKVMTLGRTTARALPELKERRDALTVRAFAGFLDERLTGHLVRYNFWLRHEHRTLAVFDELADRGASQDKCRAVLFPEVLDLLIGLRRYEDALTYAVDPLIWINPLLTEQRELLAKSAASEPHESPAQQAGPAPSTEDGAKPENAAATPAKPGSGLSASDAARLKELRQELALRTGYFYEALLGSGRGADAHKLVELVTDFHATGRIFNLLIQHALRVEMPLTARRLEQMASGLLSEKGMQLVRRAARKIPADTPQLAPDPSPDPDPSEEAKPGPEGENGEGKNGERGPQTDGHEQHQRGR
ncbi:MAG: hypothetical protein CMJ87_07630 [Planctomycetes bacterium]|nr:hypothetical protein [Planctomycetota bacterium]